METTKPKLSSSRAASASSERMQSDVPTVRPLSKEHLQQHDAERRNHWERRQSNDANSDARVNPTTITSVLASVNRMQMLRQRTLGLRGNITTSIPLRKFNPTVVKEEMERILVTALKGVTYDAKRASILSKKISETIRSKVKTMKFPRYKFVALVTISSQSNQCMMVGSRCLWNAGSDSYVTVHYNNDTLAAVATLYAVFKE